MTSAFNEWRQKRKSRTGYLGSRHVERRQKLVWGRILGNYGVTLVIVKPGTMLGGSDLHTYMMQNSKRAAFLSSSRTIYVLKGFTYFEIAHEFYHAKHQHELGEELYSRLDELEKETYVYDALMLKANKLTAAEVADAKSYINRILKRFGYPPRP